MLDQILQFEAFAFMMLFARLGTFLAFLPGFSANYVQTRTRLILALALAAAIYPAVGDQLPPLPGSLIMMVLLLVFEMTIGLFMAMVVSALFSALQTAGTVIGFNSGLAMATIFDPVSENQNALIAGLLDLIGITLVFVLGLHDPLIRAIVESYTLFVPGVAPMTDDMAGFLTRTAADAFNLGVRLAAPFLVFAIVVQSGMGIISRLMPQMNVFFVIIPLNILLAMALLSIVLPTLMLAFFQMFEGRIVNFITLL